VRVETYESLKELTRGAGFRIDKYVLAEKATHKPVRTEYRLTREGLAGTPVFSRLADAQTAATEPLPEPAPDVTPEIVTEEAAPDETPPSE
jgi:DNA-binding HxlR family transcriptional regulator